MATVQLDTVEPGNDTFQQYLRDNDIVVTVLQENGPGGGNSLVQYSGSKQSLEAMIEEHFFATNQRPCPEAQMLKGLITE